MAEVVSRARVLPHDGDAGDLGCLLKGAEVSDIGEASLLHERDRLTCAVAGAAVDEVLGFGVEARIAAATSPPLKSSIWEPSRWPPAYSSAVRTSRVTVFAPTSMVPHGRWALRSRRPGPGERRRRGER